MIIYARYSITLHGTRFTSEQELLALRDQLAQYMRALFPEPRHDCTIEVDIEEKQGNAEE